MKKKIVYLLLLISLFSFKLMSFTLLDYKSAIELKKAKDTHFYMHVNFNAASVYMLKDSTFLVIPINPFAKSILIEEKSLLEKYIKEEHFPADEKPNLFYTKNKNKIDDYLKYKDSLKQSLCDYALEGKSVSILSSKDIEDIYNVLKSKKKLEAFKLNFIALVGDYLIENSNGDICCWGLLNTKQLLNPLVNIVLVSSLKSQTYFNIEEAIFGKFGFTGLQSLDQLSKNFKRKPNDLEVLNVMYLP